jgi:IS5 family transposase
LAVDASGMPIRAIITNGTEADCTKAGELIDGIKAKYLLRDKRGYHSDVVINLARKRKIILVIPFRIHRKTKRVYYK